jgi:hypothetical protein
MPADLVLRRANRADALICSQLYQAEPVHFVRQISRFSSVLQEPVRDSYIHADAWIVERAGQVVAYLLLGVPYEVEHDAGVRHVPEYAGSRLALVESLPALMAAGALQELILPVAWQELELLQLMRDRGYSGRMTSLDGYTLRIIDFPGLMKDLRPVLLARLEKKLLRGLRFEQKGPRLAGSGEDRYTIARAAERLELDGAAMTLLVMGDAAPQAEAVHGPGALADVISALFPLPSFLPGLNYY